MAAIESAAPEATDLKPYVGVQFAAIPEFPEVGICSCTRDGSCTIRREICERRSCRHHKLQLTQSCQKRVTTNLSPENEKGRGTHYCAPFHTAFTCSKAFYLQPFRQINFFMGSET
jgi:hypothetical protein